MAVVSLEKTVILFIDEDTEDVQGVTVDPDDIEPWIVVSHCGEEISMSLKNWESLVTLSWKAKKKAKKNE